MSKDTSHFTIPGGIDLLAQVRESVKKTATKTKPRVLGFPVEALPARVQQIIKACEQHLNYPSDFTASGMLYAISLAIGNTRIARMAPGWTERPVLYMASVGNPGTNKSAPNMVATDPIRKRDKESYRIFEREKADYEEHERAAKGKKDSNLKPPPKPVFRKTLVSDITPEAIAKVLRENPRGIGLYVDELAGWFKNFNRYSKGSEQEQWLSNWSGGTIVIDRKGGDSILISDPFVSVLGTIQPAVLEEMAKEGRGQNGFMDRILFAFPPNLKSPKWNDNEIDQAHLEEWQAIVYRLLDIPLEFDDFGNIKPQELRFSSEAKAILKAWQHEKTDEVNAEEDDQARGIQAKMFTYAIRLALILQMMQYACGEDSAMEIGTKAVNGALSLVGYFQATAERVYAIATNSNPLESLTENQRRLYLNLPDSFKTSEGKKIAIDQGMSGRGFERFVKRKTLFNRIATGHYSKVA